MTRGCRNCLLGVLLAVGCQPPAAPADREPPGDPWFADVSAAVGLDFSHDAGAPGTYFLPQIMGSGAAFLDVNNDNRLDMYLVQNGGPGSGSRNRLYRQGADGRFADVSAGSGLDVDGYGMGVAVGDVNNDGWVDVLVTGYSGVRLFLNNGNGTFTEVTREAGLGGEGWATSACFVDYDRDGWLDVVVACYLDYNPSRHCTSAGGVEDYCNPKTFPGRVTRLYRNLGRLPPPGSKGVRFEDRTAQAGFARRALPGLGVAAADFDGDGWPDILVANDAQPNCLWINQKDGTFREEALVRGVALDGIGASPGNMGIALGDVDGDGLADVFVTHLTSETHTLWRQGPPGMFADRTASAGLAGRDSRSTGFGTVFADFDLDGTLDLAICSGRVSRSAPDASTDRGIFWRAYAESNQLFAGEDGGHFRNVAAANQPFCGSLGVSRGLAVGDVDNDGAPDLLVTAVAGPARLFRNVARRRGHWLTVRAVDPSLKRTDPGAEVTVDAGGRSQTRWLNPGSSYLCSHDPRAHFGLGPADRVDAVRVRWWDGTRESFPGVAADQAVTIRKGSGQPK